MPQIHNSRGGGRENMGIEFSATASLVSAVAASAGCQFSQFRKKFSCRKLNYASISSCTATFDTNFHSIEIYSICSKFNNTGAIRGLRNRAPVNQSIMIKKLNVYQFRKKEKVKIWSKSLMTKIAFRAWGRSHTLLSLNDVL